MKSVVVIGGGPAGCAATIVLARGGARVTLVAADAVPRAATVESLPPQTSRLLRELGVWEPFLALEPLPSPGNLSLWGDDIPRATDFIFNPHGHGWHIERRRFDAMLLEAAHGAGATVVCGRAERVRREAGGWEVLVQSEISVLTELDADMLIWAGGRNAPLPAAFGATRRKLDSLMAVAALLPASDTERDPRTWTEAARDGWWYASPALNGQRLITFFTDADYIPPRDRAAWWRDELSATHLISRRAPAAHAPSCLHTLCAYTTVTEPAADDSWMTIGDAALALDPLSATGTTLALTAGRIVAAEILGKREPGEYAAWIAGQFTRYELERRAIYSRERRWPDSEFWLCRQTAGNHSTRTPQPATQGF